MLAIQFLGYVKWIYVCVISTCILTLNLISSDLLCLFYGNFSLKLVLEIWHFIKIL